MDILKPDWIQEIINPLPVDAVGINPKHEEEFCNLKQEVEKLSGIDFAKIKALSIGLLSNKSKDLRVAGYLLFACSYLDNIEMIVHVLFAYEHLVNLYWEYIHPQKSVSRMSAIDWLNNERLTGFIIKKLDNSDKSQIQRFLERINSLNKSLVAQGGDAVVQYSCLNKILKEKEVDIRVSIKDTGVDVKSAEPSKIVLQSREDVEVITRNIIAYFNKNGQRLYAAAFARALKWSALNPEATLDNKTAFTPPCEADKKELKCAVEAGEPKALYQTCEKQFLNIGGHVNFDLQYYAYQAAIEMGEKRLAQYLELEFKSLTRCVPQLMVLMYKDGSPFLTEKTREWLEFFPEMQQEPKQKSQATDSPSNLLANIKNELNHLTESDQASFERKLAKSILFLTATMM